MKKEQPKPFADIFLSKLLKFRRFKENVNFTFGSNNNLKSPLANYYV